ncbi:Hypothetical protein A7982_01923 [Minicystis rosea]|nr:Hypothetical protein A7982_01923 [Minicystis rosea]
MSGHLVHRPHHRILLAAVCATAGACGGPETGSPRDAGAAGPLTAETGAIRLAAGQESTVCRTFRLGNDTPLLLRRITAELGTGSHHLILYRSADTQESPTPTACTPFGGILGGGQVPIMIAQSAHAELSWPEGVALRIEAHQMVKLEVHFLNTSASDLEAHAEAELEGVPEEQGKELAKSDISFWGTTKINIPPNGTQDTGVLFQSGIAGTKAFATTTHQHRLGTRFEVWYAASDAADPSDTEPLAETTSWADPPLYQLDPELAFDGQNGLKYRCEWKNPTSTTVTFGESALQEMCFFWVYYYPSRGFDVCIDGTCYGR